MAYPHKVMSMEAALEEERREVEALIAARNRRPPSALSGVRSSSPFTPRSPVRSMLDIGEYHPSPQGHMACNWSQNVNNVVRHGGPTKSMLDVDGPPAAPKRSMLDMDSPPASASSGKQVFSTPSSPVLASNQLARASNASHPRHMSDVASRPVGFGPRSDPNRDLTSEYQFSDIITSNTGHAALPKRVSQGNKKTAQPPSAMSHIVRGSDVSRIPLPGDTRGRHSIAGPGMRIGSKSRSPHSRLGIRSQSPAANLLSGRHLSPAGRAFVEETYGVDMSNAYRRLSDANLLRSGGSLAEIGRKKKFDDNPDGGRLAKDYLTPDGDDLYDDSSDDQDDSNAEEGERGRKAARNFDGLSPDSDKAGAKADKDRTALSLLAAAEEERKDARFPRCISHTQYLLPAPTPTTHTYLLPTTYTYFILMFVLTSTT